MVEFGPQSWRVLSIALLGFVSCTGQIGDLAGQSSPGAGASIGTPPSSEPPSTGDPPPPGDPPPGDPEPPPESCVSQTTQRARRISLGEYERAVSRLFDVNVGVANNFAPEPSSHGFDNQSDKLAISSGNFEEFAAAAEMAAEEADVAARAPCAPDALPENCASEFVTSFARQAYGRKLSEAELADLSMLYQQGALLDGYERGIRTVMAAILLSPHFLYREEIGVARPEGAAILSADEVANAVAFALTGLRPDAELLARAALDPAFRSPSVLREEAKRLVATPEARQHLARFLRGWLGVPDLRTVNKIPALFPSFTPRLKADLDTELDLFLEYVLGDEGGTLEALLGSTVTFASAPLLATIYAGDYRAPLVPPAPPAPGEFAKIELNTKIRKGVLSLGGWLAAHAPVHRSSPVDRGLAIRTRFFCHRMEPPPPGATATAPGPGDGAATTRQKFEAHANNVVCRSCHQLMDPIGFGMEMMDALGAYRDTEAGLPVDSSGTLTNTDVDGPFQGPAELADKLLASRQVRDCFVVQMFRYIEGRDEIDEDSCAISRLQGFFGQEKTSIGELATEMVSDPRFIYRSIQP